jgi:hypothetical protein
MSLVLSKLNLTLVPSGVVGDADEKAELLTGDMGTSKGWSVAEVDSEDGDVSEGEGFSCACRWVRTLSTTHPE